MVELVERAIDLNPHHPRWVYYVLATNHYRKGDVDKALVEAERANLTQFVWTPLCVAVAAGQLGRSADARAALDAISERYASYLEPARVRALWTRTSSTDFCKGSRKPSRSSIDRGCVTRMCREHVDTGGTA